jgi:hypothetical protein
MDSSSFLGTACILENLRYFHVVFLSVDLRVKIFNLTIQDTNSKC